MINPFVLSILVAETLSKASGTFTAQIQGRTQAFVLEKGKLTIQGKRVALKPSNDDEYPTTSGWFKYSPKSFIQVPSTTDIKVVASVGSKMVPVTVTKAKPAAAKGNILF